MTEEQIRQIEDNIRYCEELLKNNPDIISADFIADEEPFEPAFHFEPVVSPVQQEKPVSPPPAPTVEQTGPILHFEPVASPIPREEAVHIPSAAGERAVGRTGTGGILRTLRSLLICAVIAVAAGVLITKFVANHTTVEGSSMEPSLKDGDNLIVEKVSYLFGDPARFDIIVFQQSENINYIKRIIGLPGEHVRIEGGKIYINDNPIYDSYGSGVIEDGGLAESTVTLGSDEYFVLGDNRNSSEDSRTKRVGSVRESQIIGKAWFRVTPVEQFGLLD